MVSSKQGNPGDRNWFHQWGQVMRHESIDTTLSYYVGRNAERTAAILREQHEKAAAPDSNPAANHAR